MSAPCLRWRSARARPSSARRDAGQSHSSVAAAGDEQRAAPRRTAGIRAADAGAAQAATPTLGSGTGEFRCASSRSADVHRIGWLPPRPLTDVQEVVDVPPQLAPVTVDDDGTALTQLG
jgi:hypothetical protein